MKKFLCMLLLGCMLMVAVDYNHNILKCAAESMSSPESESYRCILDAISNIEPIKEIKCKGEIVQFEYNEYGQRVRKIHQNQSVEYVYEQGVLTEEVRNGHRIIYHYDESQQVVVAMEIDDVYIELIYDSNGNVSFLDNQGDSVKKFV